MIDQQISVQQLQEISKNTMVEHLGIEFLEASKDYLKAKMPVDQRTHQPMGLLHGGASVALAETLGSVASSLVVDLSLYDCVGLEINANHVKSVRSGYVQGISRAIHLGKKTHIWDIRITNEKDELVCISRLTVAIIDKKTKND